MTSVISRAIVAVLMAFGLAAQQAPPRDAPPSLLGGTARIAGVVTGTDAGHTPVRRVTVTLKDAVGTSLLAVTDDKGQYEFRGLPAGRYTLTAARPGYLTTTYGAAKPGRPGIAVPLAEGQQMASLPLTIARGGVITGTITTADGLPASGINVQALSSTPAPTDADSLRVLLMTGGQRTDDLGNFRLYGLPPGDYVILAIPPVVFGSGARPTTDAEYQRAVQQIRTGATGATAAVAAPFQTTAAVPMFFPGTTEPATAQRIHLGLEDERNGVNFSIRPAPTAKINGLVLGLDGQPMPDVSINVQDSRNLGPLAGGFRFEPAASDRNGKFTLNGIAPGRYWLTARKSPGGTSAPAAVAFAEVETNGTDTSVVLTVEKGAAMSGVVDFEPGGSVAPPSDLGRLLVSLAAVQSGRRAEMMAPGAYLDAAGHFVLKGIVPGRYRVVVSLSGASQAGNPVWFIKSATTGQTDFTDGLLTIDQSDVDGVHLTLTDRPSELSGRMLDADGRPAPEYFLIAFPKDDALQAPEFLRTRQARPGADGKYSFRGLPAGDYFLAAVADIEPGQLSDKTFLQTLTSSAVPVTIFSGQKKVVDLKVK